MQIHSTVLPTGKDVYLRGNLDAIEDSIQDYLHYKENGEPAVNEEYTEEQADECLEKLKTILAEGYDWDSVLKKMPTKKDGTLTKNRIQEIWRGEPFGHESEEVYAFVGPAIYIKATDHDLAELRFEYCRKLIAY